MSTERRRFTTGKYDHDLGGYPVYDRSRVIAWFTDQGLAIQYCRILRAAPQLANSCESCYPHLRCDEAAE